jgi:hypothetical protein
MKTGGRVSREIIDKLAPFVNIGPHFPNAFHILLTVFQCHIKNPRLSFDWCVDIADSDAITKLLHIAKLIPIPAAAPLMAWHFIPFTLFG